ncbi:MAG: hypothetical protein A2W00_06155 [Candidatus Eisenbacteria bacterium RBG_16_71_46]|nr:MAG: hypothetical protein A2W00_06155 [Candidatus Eisenbacteria bacterium RBG_16_71_46]
MGERQRFPRNFNSLKVISEFVAAFLAARGIDPAHAFEADLVIEELFTNMVKYAGGGAHDIEIGLEGDRDVLTITLRDFDVDAFDVTRVRPVDTCTPAGERQPGGLGIHLVRQIADSLEYEYKDRNSTITVTKKLRS